MTRTNGSVIIGPERLAKSQNLNQTANQSRFLHNDKCSCRQGPTEPETACLFQNFVGVTPHAQNNVQGKIFCDY